MHGLGDKLEEKREPRGRELRKSISAVFFLCYRRGLAGEAPPKVGPWYRAGLQLPVVAGAPGPVPGGEQKQGAFSPLPSACWCSDSVFHLKLSLLPPMCPSLYPASIDEG